LFGSFAILASLVIFLYIVFHEKYRIHIACYYAIPSSGHADFRRYRMSQNIGIGEASARTPARIKAWRMGFFRIALWLPYHCAQAFESSTFQQPA
jgi:hypothetical protein